MRRDGPIVVYGATGYTGRLVAAELARRGLDAVLTGRDTAKLRALRADLHVDWPLRAAPLDDLVALRAVGAGAAVVLSCAGPFTRLGAPLIDAALAAGAHGAALSGAGSSLLALCDAHATGVVAAAMDTRANELGVHGETLALDIDRCGLELAAEH